MSNVSTSRFSLVKLAHTLIKDSVKTGDIVIDATVGNGHDTLFLMDLVKPSGKVFGFDIQLNAVESVKAKLQNQPFAECVTLINAGHESMGERVPMDCHGKISAVMFNLGYLPGSDKRVITQTNTTLAALASARELVSVGGIITVLAYPGHEGGKAETDRVSKWCLALDPSQYQVNHYESQPNNPLAPRLFMIKKYAKE